MTPKLRPCHFCLPLIPTVQTPFPPTVSSHQAQLLPLIPHSRPCSLTAHLAPPHLPPSLPPCAQAHCPLPVTTPALSLGCTHFPPPRCPEGLVARAGALGWGRVVQQRTVSTGVTCCGVLLRLSLAAPSPFRPHHWLCFPETLQVREGVVRGLCLLGGHTHPATDPCPAWDGAFPAPSPTFFLGKLSRYRLGT